MIGEITGDRTLPEQEGKVPRHAQSRAQKGGAGPGGAQSGGEQQHRGRAIADREKRQTGKQRIAQDHHAPSRERRAGDGRQYAERQHAQGENTAQGLVFEGVVEGAGAYDDHHRGGGHDQDDPRPRRARDRRQRQRGERGPLQDDDQPPVASDAGMGQGVQNPGGQEHQRPMQIEDVLI